MATNRGGIEYEDNDAGSDYTPAPTPERPATRPTADNLLLNPAAYSGDRAASNMIADLYRAQWEDYLKRFGVLETEVRDSILSGERMDSALERVAPAVQQQYGLAKQGAEQRLQRYGLTPSGDVKEQQDASFQRGMMSTEAALRNRVRQGVKDSNMQLISGMSANTERKELNQ